MFLSGAVGCYANRMKATTKITELDILEEVIQPTRGNLSRDAAQSSLDWKFSRRVTARINRLARLNAQDKLSADERHELDLYLRVGGLINLMQAKARASLKPRKSVR